MTITRDRAIEMLEAAVEKYGANTIYQHQDQEWYSNSGTCRYVDDAGCAKCLIGVVLIENDLTTASALEPFNTFGITRVAQELHLDIEEAALSVLGTAQDKQDRGATWGVAVAAARVA